MVWDNFPLEKYGFNLLTYIYNHMLECHSFNQQRKWNRLYLYFSTSLMPQLPLKNTQGSGLTINKITTLD